MSRNTHAEKATELVIAANIGGSHLDPDTVALMSAQSEATQAVAYEQRTANLIAMYADGASGPVPGIDYEALLNQIKERLDIE